ncbi:type II toxin-antitoxin system prevent-host-death family antitoxin [Marinitenerispora sediminis]|nr:type II toxin-antitoxin system prevent-host-death family antitoxin [Marinitenerispora sediminis]
MSEVTLQDARTHLGQLVSRVAHAGEPVTITRYGRPEGVLISPDAYQELQELRREKDRRDLARLADHLGVNSRTLRSWEQDRDPIPDGVRLEVERLEQQTEEVVGRVVDALMDMPEPAVQTYQTDEQYRKYEPDQPWPAAWHRRVVARAAQEVPGLVIVAPE